MQRKKIHQILRGAEVQPEEGWGKCSIQCVSQAASGQGQAPGLSGAGREGQLGVGGGVETRPRKDIQGQLGVGEDFQQGMEEVGFAS